MKSRLSNFSKLLKLGLLLGGLAVRLYLDFSLPLWIDESISTMVIKGPFSSILLGTSDPVHPPFFYLFLKLWGIFSDHLFWLRLSSSFLFVFNVFLLDKIGQKIKDDKFSLILIFCYIFSGYFVIFDWQARMYTGLLSLILLSFYFFLSKRWLLFTFVNVLGLYFDYGFFWYLAPLVFLVWHNKKMFWSLAVSFSLFSLWVPSYFLERGLEGINWLKDYVSPGFFLPYFLGAFDYFLALPLLALVAFGLRILKERGHKEIFLMVVLPAVISLTATFIFSYLFSPLLHVRSLQIVGLSVIFLLSLVVEQLFLRAKFFGWLFCSFYLLNFFLLTANLLSANPQNRLVNFFPWKTLKAQKIEKTDIRFVIFKVKDKSVLSPVIWGLKYTLWGKESVGSRQIPVFEEGKGKSASDCQMIYDRDLQIYGCK